MRRCEGSWERIIGIANSNFVTPALWPAFKHLELDNNIPDDARQYLAAFHEMNCNRNAGIMEQLRELANTAADSCGRAILLKGAAMLASDAYPDYGERMLTDIDIMFDQHLLASATEMLGSLGYQTVGKSLDRARTHHHLQPMFKPGTFAVVEVHRQPLSFLANKRLTGKELWSGAKPSEQLNPACLRPSPEHMVVMGFLHSEIVDRNLRHLTINLRLLQDLLAIQRHVDPDINWNAVEKKLLMQPDEKLWSFVRGLLQRLGGLDQPTGSRPPTINQFRWHMLQAARNWNWLERLATRIDRLSKPAIERRLGPQHGFMELNRSRLQIISNAASMAYHDDTEEPRDIRSRQH
jgi:hypothetical protein